MLHRALKMWFWVTYDHLGRVLLLNVLCMVPVLALIGLAASLGGLRGLLIVFTALFLLPCMCLAALGHVARGLIEQHEAPVALFLDGLRRFALPGLLLGLLFGAVMAVGLGGAYYYLFVLARPAPGYAYPLAAVCLWGAACAGAALNLALPALAQKRAGTLAAARTGVLLLADNPVYALGVALHAVALIALGLAPPAFLAFSIVPLAVLQGAAYEMLARKYAAPLVDGKRRIVFSDAEDDYLNRGLRDFFFPWKM